jgi:hypothetical protein
VNGVLGATTNSTLKNSPKLLIEQPGPTSWEFVLSTLSIEFRVVLSFLVFVGMCSTLP